MAGLIGSAQAVARRHKRMWLFVKGEPVPDGEGGYVEPDVPLDPPDAFGRVQPASQRSLEDITAGTVLAQATHLVSMPFRRDVTIETTLLVEDYPDPHRRLSVLAIANPDERDADLELVCAEVLENGAPEQAR